MAHNFEQNNNLTCTTKNQPENDQRWNNTSNSLNFWNFLQTRFHELGDNKFNPLKNIISLNNLDSPTVFKDIDNEVISELEKYAKEDMSGELNSDDNLVNYFGNQPSANSNFVPAINY